MQEKKRIPLKRLHRLRNARKQAAETDDLTPMMKAIKAVHSVTSTGSTQPEDLERQRAAQELAIRSSAIFSEPSTGTFSNPMLPPR